MRIYLEIDGVINAPQAASLWGQKTFDSIDFGGYTFVWATSAVAELLSLCEESDAEIVWLTSWSEDIPVLARMLGFGHIGAEGRIVEEIGVGSTPFEKADALLQDVASNPVGGAGGWVWLDPVSEDVLQSSAYVQRMLIDGGGGFVPPLSEVVGITPSLMKYLRDELAMGKMRKTLNGEGSDFDEGGEKWT
jgi:hypothetical protein